MEIPPKIQQAIRNNSLVIFAGSGLSLKFKLPDWNKLVEDIINASSEDAYKSFIPILKSGLMKPIEILDKLASEHHEIKTYISKNFKILDGDFSLHENILKLSGQIITTNYDNAFEQASKNTITPAIYTSDFNISEINKSNEPYIFKLHGSVTEPDHCIIFNKQYQNLYLEETSAKQKLKNIFSEKTILFIGFSFKDPDINLIFENLDKIFGHNNKHFILTKEKQNFESFNFLEPISLKDYSEIDLFIHKCLEQKNAFNPISTDLKSKETIQKNVPKALLLFPKPIDLKLSEDLLKIHESFETIDLDLFIGPLNVNTLERIEDYDLIIIASQVYKNNIYIEDINLKSSLLSVEEICSNITNESIPIIFITNEKIEIPENCPIINIPSLKKNTIKKFVYKVRERKLNFDLENEATGNLSILEKINFSKGNLSIKHFYENLKDLEIGKKCLTNVVGRIEEQSSIALKLISISKSNKILNIKASGGTGKTTIIKKVAYELYNRGYYKKGVTFKSCENVKTFSDFEESLINGFNLTNILNFKEYLIENYSSDKIDLLVILDNFETVVNVLNSEELIEVIELLKFASDYANIVITSRERLSPLDDFEDVYSLTPLITDDAVVLFEKHYGSPITNISEIKILRQEILEDLLNNNPLAIKLVTSSRTSSKSMSELRDQLQKHFFESINEDYSLVFKNNADLNIERTKSIYQSINYSYTTLNSREKIAFELLSLFPDGISLHNFKKCFIKSSSSNNITDKELIVLRNKSLVEDYNGTLQLQPIIRRFADHQFSKRSKEIKQKYCSDAYLFNCHILKLIELVEDKKSTSEALIIYNYYKNNLLNVLRYIPDIELSEKSSVPEKKFLLNYIYILDDFIVNEKQIIQFEENLNQLQSYFSDLPNSKTFIEVLAYNKTYYFKEFDQSYKKLSSFLSVEEMEQRVYEEEDYIECRYKNIISLIHSMEGYTFQRIKSLVLNNDYSRFLNIHFFYLGIPYNITTKKHGFYYFENALMFNRINAYDLEKYINSLHQEEHLEIMQSTYTLSKIKKIDRKVIQKLVITNPYTKGLKQLMYAFIAVSNEEKIKYFEDALKNLFHIKYYYLEALYYYCKFLNQINSKDYQIKLDEGLLLSNKFYYQHLSHLFTNITNSNSHNYEFKYSFYPLPNMEDYVNNHNIKWDKDFKESEIDN